ncbi:hypothetical protein Taro_014171, partial [Colocasia esculenta]|nr:hypothetical protein [Colocasia esculenta]
ERSHHPRSRPTNACAIRFAPWNKPLPLSLSLSSRSLCWLVLLHSQLDSAVGGASAMENGGLPGSSSSPSTSSLVFLGTGCSSMVPNAVCLIQPSDPPCPVCSQALSVPPQRNPNYRCNTSLLIDYCPDDDEHNYILIDVGKTFREQVVRWFTYHKIPRVDSIILTHEHADAVLGLDDIRAVQPFSPTNDIDPTPIYLTQFSMDSISVKFPYLVPRKLREGEEVRRVAQLDWRIIESDHKKPFTASGLQFVPLPVMHGEDYVSLGFLFGEKSKVAYISDVSRFPESTEYVISKYGAGRLDLLILDTLYKGLDHRGLKLTQIGGIKLPIVVDDGEYVSNQILLYKVLSQTLDIISCCINFVQVGPHNTHLCLPQSLEAVKRICPKRALFVGMTHELDHHKDNLALADWSRREGIPVQLAHDGLRIFIDL